MSEIRYPDAVPAGYVSHAIAHCPGPVVGDR
jgi:hypothetical protein